MRPLSELIAESRRLIPMTSERCGWSDHLDAFVHVGRPGQPFCRCGEHHMVDPVGRMGHEQRTGDETI